MIDCPNGPGACYTLRPSHGKGVIAMEEVILLLLVIAFLVITTK